MNNKTKKFLKPTLFKIILAIIISFFPLVGKMLYSRNIFFNETTSEIETNIGIKIMYNISNIFVYPTKIITSPFQKFFGERYITCSIAMNCPFYINLFLFLYIALIFVIESYLLSCLIVFLIIKLKK